MVTKKSPLVKGKVESILVPVPYYNVSNFVTLNSTWYFTSKFGNPLKIILMKNLISIEGLTLKDVMKNLQLC